MSSKDSNYWLNRAVEALGRYRALGGSMMAAKGEQDGAIITLLLLPHDVYEMMTAASEAARKLQRTGVALPDAEEI